MKATLKHASGQYVLIVDERPKQNEWYYYINSELNDPISQALFGYGKHSDWWRIIAAENLEGIKGIRFKCYDTETNRYIITSEPKEYVKPYIDTEVELTEEEDYWVVRL